MIDVALLAILAGVVIQILLGRIVISTLVPFFGYISWSVHNEFFVPYQGGGASFWPLDIAFAGPVAACSGFAGAFLAIKLFGVRDHVFCEPRSPDDERQD
jgi:hypothetical protein